MPESLGTAQTAKLTVTNTKETTVYLEKKQPLLESITLFLIIKKEKVIG